MKHRFFKSKRSKWLLIFGLLTLLILAVLPFIPYPYSQFFEKKASRTTGSTTIDTRYMSEVTGIETPKDMQRQYKRHSEEYKYSIDDDLAVMFAYPDPNIRWTGMVFIHHFPSVSEVVLDYDGNVIFEQITSPLARARMDGLLNDIAFVQRLQNQMNEIWELDDPGEGVLGLVDSLQAAGFKVEFLGGRPQTLFDASMFLIRVNDKDISVYEFDHEAARRAISDNISPDGYEFTQQEGEKSIIIHIEYLDEPNFWTKKNLLVQYLGQDKIIIDSLSSALGDPITDHGVGETDICNLSPFPDLVFPRQEPVEGLREVMEAELVGSFVLDNGCLRVESLYNDDSYLPVWPPDFALEHEDDTLVIVDGNGNKVAQVGEEVYMGGGIGSESSLPDCVRQQLTSSCHGPFWIVGEGVRPNLRYDSDLINLEFFPFDNRSVILISKNPILDEWVAEQSVISGVLRLYHPQRCPRIQSESGHTDYLPIWPTAYSIQMTDGQVEILNGSGDVVAQEGAEVIFHGGPIPPGWDSKRNRQLYYNIPGDCFGPYWIINEIP